MVLLSACLLAQSPLWGPVTLERTTGAPDTYQDTFAAPDSTWEYSLQVLAATDSGEAVSSAWIEINGSAVVRPQDFNQNVNEIEVPISLDHQNQVDMRLAGLPGSKMEVAIYGPSVSQNVSSNGGSLNLPGIAEVTIPPGSFDESVPVTLYTAADSLTRDIFDISTIVFAAGPAMPFELRINTNTVKADSSLWVTLMLPGEFIEAMGNGRYEAQAFVQLEETGGGAPLDNFDVFESTVDIELGTISVELPPWAFTSSRTANDTFEAIIIIGTTQAIWEDEL